MNNFATNNYRMKRKILNFLYKNKKSTCPSKNLSLTVKMS